MKELIQSILIYVVIVSLLKGLITNPKYSQYFQFFSGIIMILIMLSPVLSILDYEHDWYDILEKNVLQMDLEEIKTEMQIADTKFEDMVEEEFEKNVAKQVIVLAEKEGINLEMAEVEAKKEEDNLVIEQITLVTGTASEVEAEEDVISIETIRMEKKRKAKEADTSKSARSLQRQICDHFVVREDKVQIWK